MSSQFDLRVLRGGGWSRGDAADLAARARYSAAPSFRGSYLGFRCVRAESGGSRRVFRGGSWGSGAALCRAAYRYDGGPGYRSIGIGLRCARRDG